ncbi:hypothetical protein C0Q70_12025 [Pomacea canaliculata]|uniref:TRADD-like N-terminal domain-containing protein n=1 Tax=Pomacea canaliculata TaxID=400727 RepID=A0A2T7P0B8_POMCA|nr:hypothetical protein C0Q70_12025 [Pomacea canaliculata]
MVKVFWLLPVTSDPVSKYLEETCKRGCQRKRKNSDASPSSENVPSSSSRQDPLSSASSSSEGSCRDSNMCSSCTSSLGSARSERHAKQSRRDGSGTSVVTAKVCHSLQVHGKTEWKANENKPEEKNGEIKKKMTCDIRLRVRAEYSQSEESLESSVHSDKEEALERQFERFTQANTILKSRDLGSIICDIKFSELTYLDAFWRDYVNGSLLEALKGVFITDSLKQAVGHETIKLMVNVDEDDYEIGRLKLLQNLMD